MEINEKLLEAKNPTEAINILIEEQDDNEKKERTCFVCGKKFEFDPERFPEPFDLCQACEYEIDFIKTIQVPRKRKECIRSILKKILYKRIKETRDERTETSNNSHKRNT